MMTVSCELDAFIGTVMFRKIRHELLPGQALCASCREPLDLTTAKTDEDGQAVHEECYVDKVRDKSPSNSKKPPATQD
jgi:hypothetical protein